MGNVIDEAKAVAEAAAKVVTDLEAEAATTDTETPEVSEVTGKFILEDAGSGVRTLTLIPDQTPVDSVPAEPATDKESNGVESSGTVVSTGGGEPTGQGDEQATATGQGGPVTGATPTGQ